MKIIKLIIRLIVIVPLSILIFPIALLMWAFNILNEDIFKQFLSLFKL